MDGEERLWVRDCESAIAVATPQCRRQSAPMWPSTNHPSTEQLLAPWWDTTKAPRAVRGGAAELDRASAARGAPTVALTPQSH